MKNKYSIGQMVWYYDYGPTLVESDVVAIEWHDIDGCMYSTSDLFQSGNWLREEQIFESKNALIDYLVSYLELQRESFSDSEEKSSCCLAHSGSIDHCVVNDECEHKWALLSKVFCIKETYKCAFCNKEKSTCTDDCEQ